MSFGVENRVAIVTGGSSGIGLETVKLLLAGGAKVAWCGRNQARLDASLEAVRLALPEVSSSDMLTIVADVLDRDSVEALINAVVQHFGGIDFLINNAGQGKVASFEETQDEDWLGEVTLKYFGVLNPIKAALPYLEQSDMASITNVNSLLALKPERHMIATSAARAGLLNLSKTLSQEFAQKGVNGIRVNSILIGMVESGQWRRRYEERSDRSKSWDEWIAGIAQERGIPMGRLGKAEEAARALLFLASPMSSYTTGSVVDVSGGFSREI
ncbi:short chain dehydrogenase [Ignatzschineria sp. F8392]|uniref:SDR family oxidoreductase n=1 Tax=Ignatzschineria sp. F8392 TaxID=1980117 RepID=UPI000B99023F|nr:SDR family oxidoreductase [Ignatzschineria sp. F8392]OYQ80770.1 short chain dehydrogenase [Ignatzschineria sp. F8392]